MEPVTYEIVDLDRELVFTFQPVQIPETDRWAIETKEVRGAVTLPAFLDDSEALLLNTVARWCIINNCTLRPALSLIKQPRKYGGHEYILNGERVFLCFLWMAVVKLRRRKSGRVRTETIQVHAENREDAEDAARRKTKGAFVLEILSMTPVGFGLTYYPDRPGLPNIDNDILERLPLPTDL